jgi:uncharacterized protein DUF5134
MFPSLAVPAFTAIFAVTGLRSLVRLRARAAGGDRTAVLSHLLMSIAMVGMAWGWPTGSDTAGGAVELGVFGLLAVVFVVRVLDPAEHSSAGSAHHLVVLAAMVWMVLSMPASDGHHGHGAEAGGAPALMQLVTVAFVVLLCATVFVPVARVSRYARVLVPAAGPHPAESETRVDPRLDRAGHVLMSGGMAAMLLAML